MVRVFQDVSGKRSDILPGALYRQQPYSGAIPVSHRRRIMRIGNGVRAMFRPRPANVLKHQNICRSYFAFVKTNFTFAVCKRQVR
jgi:hypothetical protein